MSILLCAFFISIVSDGSNGNRPYHSRQIWWIYNDMVDGFKIEIFAKIDFQFNESSIWIFWFWHGCCFCCCLCSAYSVCEICNSKAIDLNRFTSNAGGLYLLSFVLWILIILTVSSIQSRHILFSTQLIIANSCHLTILIE